MRVNWRNKTIFGIEVHFQDGLNPLFRVCTMEFAGNSMKFDVHGIYEDIDTIPEKLIKHKPIIVLVNGKGVLSKGEQTNSIKQVEKDVLGRFFPNANTNEFITSYSFSGRNLWMSVSRKEQCSEIFNNIERRSGYIINIQSGVHHVSRFIELLYADNCSLKSSTNEFLINHGILEKIDESTNSSIEYEVGDDYVNADYFPLLGYIYSFLLEEESIEFNIDEKIIARVDEYVWYSRYKKLLIYGVTCVFTVLLINFLFFSRLREDTLSLSDTVSHNQATLNQYDTLLSEFEQKKSFLRDAGLLNSINMSMIADQIAATVPQSISLEYLSIFPAELKEDKINILEIIQLKGHTPGPNILDSWVDTLVSLPILQSVEVNKYEHILESSYAEFELLIEPSTDAK